MDADRYQHLLGRPWPDPGQRIIWGRVQPCATCGQEIQTAIGPRFRAGIVVRFDAGTMQRHRCPDPGMLTYCACSAPVWRVPGQPPLDYLDRAPHACPAAPPPAARTAAGPQEEHRIKRSSPDLIEGMDLPV